MRNKVPSIEQCLQRDFDRIFPKSNLTVVEGEAAPKPDQVIRTSHLKLSDKAKLVLGVLVLIVTVASHYEDHRLNVAEAQHMKLALYSNW